MMSIRTGFGIIGLVALGWFGLPAGPVLAQSSTTPSGGQMTDVSLSVKYVSAEHVYLDGGNLHGLSPGDSLSVTRDGDWIATVVVDFVAEHSASCRIERGSPNVKPGDTARGRVRFDPPAPRPRSPELSAPDPIPDSFFNRASRRPLAKLRGTISAVSHRLADASASDLDFSQSTFRINFRAREILGRPYTLTVKARLRHDDRTRPLSSIVPQSEWRDRIYALNLSYHDPTAAFNYDIGRIAVNELGGVGYLDGALVKRRLTGRWRVGVFGGTQPDWRNAEPQRSIQKYGGFVQIVRSGPRSRGFEGAIALTGEYQGRIVNREFVYLWARLRPGPVWTFTQSMELDINRGWRHDRSGERVTLSSLYATGRFTPTRWMTANLSYDNRTNYLTTQSLSVPDSLFDDAFRHGVRASVNLRSRRAWSLTAGGGYRKREGELSSTTSWNLVLSRRAFFSPLVTLTVQVYGFSSYLASGLNPSVRLRRRFPAGHTAGLAVGTYAYDATGLLEKRYNNWVRGEATYQLPFSIFVAGEYEYAWGDDLPGHRMTTEVGYRF